MSKIPFDELEVLTRSRTNQQITLPELSAAVNEAWETGTPIEEQMGLDWSDTLLILRDLVELLKKDHACSKS